MAKQKEVVETDNIKQALIKRALGFEAIDEVKEYAVDENEKLKLTKKKVTKKFISPDISAAKALLEIYYKDNKSELKTLTNEELIAEKERLLNLLKNTEKESESEN